ncbi:MAG: Lrp/AsnC family transcriptional regulator [Betaproteobacteria bacterium]
MDEVDRQIIRFLQQDGRMPLTEIAARLRLAEGTVRKRLARLLEEGIVRITAVVDPERLGKATTAIVRIKVDGDRGPEVAETLRMLPEVRYLGFSAGEYDLILQVVVESNEQLFQFLTGRLREIEGVEASDTSLILRTVKEADAWFDP